MPDQVLPITDLHQTGVVLDNPAVSLPANAFSDVRNVRFRDGAIGKMEGEVNVFPFLFNSGSELENTTLKYVAYWQNPNLAGDHSGYYLIIVERVGEDADNIEFRNDEAWLIQPHKEGDQYLAEKKGTFQADTDGNWQHTFFQGGFSIIINNGLNIPHYITDNEGNMDIKEVPNFAPLPGWESYLINEVLLRDTFTSTSSRKFDTGQLRTAETQYVVTKNEDTDNPLVEGTGDDEYEVTQSDGQDVITFGDTAIVEGDTVQVNLQSIDPVEVRAGVIRSFGDFLVAGNLTETVGDEDNRVILRNLPGVVRASDVALAGSIPANWNPFAAGVSTADEFVVSDTGIVQDMAELQGNLLIYANNSISVMRPTGNASIPHTISTVTNSYGAQTTEAVLEFDGQHIVVGANDIYVFGGHPGTIKSIADGRVRNYFFDSLNPLHEARLFMLRYQQKDEIWICYPTKDSVRGECNQALIWNYRLNNWTIRDLRNVIAGDIGPVPGGGLPFAAIQMSGLTGNNGIVATGAYEAQTLYYEGLDLPGARDGVKASATIDIADTFPGFVANGPDTFDLIIGDDFDTGTSTSIFTPLNMTITMLDEVQQLVTDEFPINVQLPAGYSTATRSKDDIRTAIRDAAIQNPAFNKYFVIENVHNTDDEFIIKSRASEGEEVPAFGGGGTGGAAYAAYTYPQHALVDLQISPLLRADQDTLTALNIDDEDCDLPIITDAHPANGGYYVDGNNNLMYEFIINIPESCIGRSYFLNTDIEYTNSDEYPRLLIPQTDAETGLDRCAGWDTQMYDNTPAGTVYGAGRGGQAQREVRTAGQDMYRDIRGEYADLTPPFIATRSGSHCFAIEVLSNGGVPTLDNVTLKAFDIKYDSVGNAQALTFSDRLGGAELEGAPPVLEFSTGFLEYDRETGQFERQLASNHFVSIHGDFRTSNSNRVEDMAKRIRDSFHVGSPVWDAEIDSSVIPTVENLNLHRVRLTGRYYARLYFDFVGLHDPSGLLRANDFIINFEKPGRRETRAAQDVDNIGLDRWDEIEYPSFRIAGPSAVIEEQREVSILRTSFDHEEIRGSEIVDQIANAIVARHDTENGSWTNSSFPIARYVQFDDDESARLLVFSRNVTVASAWTAVIDKIGNNNWDQLEDGSPSNFVPTIRNTRTEVASGNLSEGDAIPGTNNVVDNTNTVTGTRAYYATPTYIGILVRNFSVPNNIELIVAAAGELEDQYDTFGRQRVEDLRGTYDISLADGSNGNSIEEVDTATAWIRRLSIANRRLLFVRDAEVDSRFEIRPLNYNDLANYVLETVYNIDDPAFDTVEYDADGNEISRTTQVGRFNELLRRTRLHEQDPDHIHFNTLGDIPFINIDDGGNFDAPLSSDGGGPVGTLQVHNTAATPPTEQRSYGDTPSMIPVGPPVSITFDVVRPWPKDETNPNLIYPVFASSVIIDDVVNRDTKIINKVLGADIGWTTPAVALGNTLLAPDPDIPSREIIISENDAAESYESYIERAQLAMTPEFDTESINSVAILAEGRTIQYQGAQPESNRLELRLVGTNYPGEYTDLSNQVPSSNLFEVGNDYKLDMRVHGRFMNMRLTDETALEGSTNVNNPTTYNQNTEWRVAGLQVKLGKAGTR